MSNPLPQVVNVAVPADGAVQRYQIEPPPALPPWFGSPGSFAACTVEPVVVPLAPVTTCAFAKVSLAGGAKASAALMVAVPAAVTVIGVDPAKRSNTIEVLDSAEKVLLTARFENTRVDYRRMLALVKRWPERTWAVEGATGVGLGLAQRLVSDGERVVDVPSKLSTRVRAIDTGHGRKNDPTDAHAVAAGNIGQNIPEQVLQPYAGGHAVQTHGAHAAFVEVRVGADKNLTHAVAPARSWDLP